MFKSHYLYLILALISCGSEDDFNSENPFGETQLTKPPGASREKVIIKETIICRDVKIAAESLVVYDSLVADKDTSLMHYFVDFKSGDFKFSLFSEKRWNRRELAFDLVAKLDPKKLSSEYARSIIENETLLEDDESGLVLELRPVTDESQYLSIIAKNEIEEYSLTINFTQIENILFVDSAVLEVKQFVAKHSETFKNSLLDYENPYFDKKAADAKSEVKQVCETKQEKSIEPVEETEVLTATVGALKGNKLKARFYYKVDPDKGTIDAVTKVPNVPLYGKYEDKRHFVVQDKKTLTLSTLRKIEIGKAFALDNDNDWTGRVKSRNDEEGFLILYIHNNSQKVKLELEVPYSNEVPSFSRGKFKIDRGIIKLSLDFK
jgi:hypothetical protein